MEAPLLDYEKLFERMEGDTDLIKEIFAIFVEEAPERREKFETALAGRDIQSMILLSHSLKGASSTLHAEPLRQASYELEHAARDGDEARMAELTPVVLELLRETANNMAKLHQEMTNP